MYCQRGGEDDVSQGLLWYNRDHRPDLKQFNYGLVVNGEGIPLLGYASDGAELKLRASCFVLITNMLDEEEHPAEKVLRDCKEQTAVELQFKAIKEPEFVGAMFVKKPERLEALAYVVLLAAMVRAIIQRRARRYAEITNEELPIPGKRMTKRPTARMILDSFDAVVDCRQDYSWLL